MQKIAIHFHKQRIIKNKRGKFAVGEICINDFRESFYSSLALWTKKDYERQWHEGLARLGDHNTSCLVASIQDPTKGPLIDWWLLYKENNKIFIRNKVLYREFYEKIIGNKNFTIASCYDFIQPRPDRLLPSGDMIAEWVINL